MLRYSGEYNHITYEIRDLHKRTVPSHFKNRTYPILVESVTRCWNCRKISNSLSRCSRCLTVRYCSKKCQINYWKSSHCSVCRSTKSYDITKWAKIIVSCIPVYEGELINVLPTALYLIDHYKIHPDNIRLNTKFGISKEWKDSSGLFTLNVEFDLLPFLERGLTPQETVNNEYFHSFPTNSRNNARMILEYGAGKLNFPQQDYSGAVKFLIDHNVDPNKIMLEDSIYSKLHRENIIYLASAGYTFNLKGSFERTGLSIIEDEFRNKDDSLADDVKELIASRPRKIKEFVLEVLIPDLSKITLDYLDIRT